jgi:vitamin B12 transporter
MKVFYYFITSFLLIQFSTTAQQADSVKTILNEVIVTATRTATPTIELANSYSLITAEQISKQQLNTVVDVLRELPGLSIAQQGGPGKLTYVFIRGANSNHTLIIMDGIVMNDPSSPSNAFDFSTLNTNDIERIEVVRGPQSTLYGSDAMAGVINIVTKKGTAKPEYSFVSETGSNGYYKGNISALGSIGFMNYAIIAIRNGSRGVSSADSKFGNSELDGYSNNSFTSRLNFNFTKNISLDLFYKYIKAQTSLDQSEKFGDDPNFNYNIEEQIFKGGLNFSLLNGNWQQKVNASSIKNFSRSLDLPDQQRPFTMMDAFSIAQRTKFDWQNTLRLIKNNLITLGIETSTEEARTSTLSESEWGPYNSFLPDTSIRTTGIYFQDQINIANTFFTAVGMRYDNHQKFGSKTTFRIAPAYFINSTSTKIKLSYGTGFKAPSLFYLFDPLYGNPDLKPEESKGWDFGVEQYFMNNNLSFGITYFNLRFENMFGYDSNYREINIAKASSNGLEITASAKNISNFSFDASYTYTHTVNEYDDSSGDFNKPLLRRPANQFSINTNYQFSPELNINLQIQYIGPRDDKDFSNYWDVKRVSLSDYTLFNIVASYQLLDYLRLTARCENIFDKQYEEVLYYGTLGRAFYIGINLTF